MLQKIHERVQGVIAWVLIILIAVTFTLFGINYYLESHSVSDVQAEVNDAKISKLDFSNTYQRLKRQAEGQAGGLTEKQEKALKERALKQLIFTRVILQGAESAGYLITREQAEQALLQIPQFQKDGQFSAEKFQQSLSSALYTPSVFLTKIQEGLVINQQRFSFAGTAFVLPQEMNQIIALVKQTRDVNYLVIPKKVFESDVSVSDAELKQYYNENKNQFKVPEKISVDYIAVSMKKILSETKVSNEAEKDYYRDNVDAYMRPAQWKWAHILIRVPVNAKKSADETAHKKALEVEKSLRNGESFAAAAKKNSGDIVSAAQGGAMPWMPESSVSPDILTVLNTLKDKGISAPIKTAYGYEIIQRTGYQEHKQMPFSEVKTQIANTLKMDKAQEVFADLGDDLTNLSYQNPSSLVETGKALGLPVETSSLFTRKGLSKGIASHKIVVQTAFADEVLQDGNNSSMITVGDDLLLVLRIHKHQPASFEAFVSVKKTIEKDVIEEKASLAAQQYGQMLLKNFNTNPEDAVTLKDAQKHGLVWKAKRQVERDDARLNRVILTALFDMPPVVAKEIHFRGVILDNGDYAVLKLTHVENGSADNLDREEHKMFEDEVEAALGIIDYNLYVEGLMHDAEIIEHSK